MCGTIISQSVRMEMIAHVDEKSVWLKWAPASPAAWFAGNKYGYHLQRLTISRDGKVLDAPEKKILLADIKPAPKEEWVLFAAKSEAAAIIAEALYGEAFDVQIASENALTIAASKSKAMNDRYGFALLSAERDFQWAVKMGLAYQDFSVKKDEEYLYQVVLMLPKVEMVVDTGRLYVNPSRISLLPAPSKPMARFGDGVVQLSWQVKYLRDYYSQYVVERSEDGGKNYLPLTEAPFLSAVPFNESAFDSAYYNDRFPKNQVLYHYRIKGVSAFGLNGKYSNPFSGMGLKALTAPEIKRVSIAKDQSKITVYWEYPDSLKAYTLGFNVESTERPDMAYRQINETMLAVSKREFVFNNPAEVNYIKVNAIRAIDKSAYASSFYLCVLEDSIPPHIPTGLIGMVDSAGMARLTWNINSDKDIFAYRVFVANAETDEFSQITVSPVREAQLNYQLDLNNLSNKLYFKVQAVDKHFNHSALSASAVAIKPDTIRPQAPIIKEITSSDTSVLLHWKKSSSLDAAKYIIYRRKLGSASFEKLAEVTGTSYSDRQTEEGSEYDYYVCAKDDAGNESEYRGVFTGRRGYAKGKGNISIRAEVDRSNMHILLKWTALEMPVDQYYLYRNEEGSGYIHIATLTGGSKEYMDNKLSVNTSYAYKLETRLENGNTKFSDEIVVGF